MCVAFWKNNSIYYTTINVFRNGKNTYIRAVLHEHNMYVNRFSVLQRKTLIFLSFQNGITLVQFSFALIFCNALRVVTQRPTQPFLQPELARIEALSV